MAQTIESVLPECPGKGNHREPIRTKTPVLFGLLNRVRVEYPKTKTRSSWAEYTGPPSRFWLRFAIVFGTSRAPNGSYDGVVVNHRWVFYKRGLGLFGDGVEELLGPQQQSA